MSATASKAISSSHATQPMSHTILALPTRPVIAPISAVRLIRSVLTFRFGRCHLEKFSFPASQTFPSLISIAFFVCSHRWMYFRCESDGGNLILGYILNSCVDFDDRGSALYHCISGSVSEYEQSLRKPNNETVYEASTISESATCATGANATVAYFLHPPTCVSSIKRSIGAAQAYVYGYDSCNQTHTLSYLCNDSSCSDCTLGSTSPRTLRHSLAEIRPFSAAKSASAF